MKNNAGKSILLFAIPLTTLLACKLGDPPPTTREGQLNESGDNSINFLIGSIAGNLDELYTPPQAICGKANGQRCNLSSSVATNTVNAFQLIEYKPACKFQEDFVTGTVRIDANRSDCKTPNTSGDVLVVSQNITRKNSANPFSNEYSSARKTSGNSLGIGGGFTFSYADRPGELNLRIGGFHKVILENEKIISDRTLTSEGYARIELSTGNFTRNYRMIRSGNALAIDNLTDVKVLYTFQSLIWNQENCCYPTAGSVIAVNPSDAKDRSVYTFSARCGEYNQIFENGNVITENLKTCGGTVY